MTRSERSAQRRKEQSRKKKKVLIGASCGVLAFLVAGGAFLAYENIANNDSTAIEKHIPTDVDAVFVSDKNPDSWEYFKVISGYDNASDLLNAEKVGVAFRDGQSYLYAQGGKELEREISERDINVEGSEGGAYLIAGDKSGFVGDGLGKMDDYVGKHREHDESFAYATNKYSNDGQFFEGESGIPTNDWLWTGTFTDKGWLGEIKDINSDQFDMKKFDAWVGFEKKPNWVRDGISKDDTGKVIISYNPQEFGEITGNKTQMANIDDIKVTIDKSNIMTLNFERE